MCAIYDDENIFPAPACHHSFISNQLLLLLALFIKPLYARGKDGHYAIRPTCRRTVARNVGCTAGVVTLQAAETVVVFIIVCDYWGVAEVRFIMMSFAGGGVKKLNIVFHYSLPALLLFAT